MTLVFAHVWQYRNYLNRDPKPPKLKGDCRPEESPTCACVCVCMYVCMHACIYVCSQGRLLNKSLPNLCVYDTVCVCLCVHPGMYMYVESEQSPTFYMQECMYVYVYIHACMNINVCEYIRKTACHVII